jgi:archaellum component FlaG (FlaF/FlaG flagellin family)
MNNSKLKSIFVILVIFASSIAGLYLTTDSVNPSLSRNSTVASLETEKAVLIINDPLKYAFFGWYRPTQFATEILNLLNRTILWASSHMDPNDVNIVFYNNPGDSYAAFVQEWLVGGGYLPGNINNQTSANIEEFDPDYYLETDLVIYWSTIDYESTNVVNSNVPFITVSVVQAEEMGIGNGMLTASGTNDTFHIVNNGYYPTENYPLTKLVLDDSYSFQSTKATSRGKLLVASEVESVTTKIEMSTMQNLVIHENGSASISFNITIPESPLSDLLRESLFENPLSLEKDVEYEVPETIPVSEESDAEETIKDVSLLGDVSDHDGRVDLEDLDLLASHIGATISDEDWVPELDLNWDGKVDMRDLAIAAHNYGKTDNNTGSLFISGYYDAELVNLTEVYYRGPEGSPKINVSAPGYIWYHLLPGTYTIFGSFNGTEKSTDAVVNPGQVAYAQLDYGGVSAPQVQQNSAPVKQSLYEGVSMEQLVLLGFDISIYDSKTIPWSTNNETVITLLASTSQLAEYIGGTDWQIRVGPIDENTTNSAAEFIFTKIQYMMLMLQSIPGDQIYTSRWEIAFDLPPSGVLQNPSGLENLNWTVDFGEGTIMQASVAVIAGRVIVSELLNVTEGNITASETYLATALETYRMFSINYTHAAPPIPTVCQRVEIERDWSKTWSYRIAPGAFVKTINVGPFSITLKATPTLNVDWFMGWERKWSKGSYRLEWFESWMKITPAIRVDASAGVSVDYTIKREYVLWTFSTRFTFWAGGVLVWAKLKLTVSVGVELNANGQFSISTWAQASAWYKAGVRWDGGWSPIWQSGRAASYGRPSISASAGVTITPYAKCRLAFLLYDVGGPFVEAMVYAPISLQVSVAQSDVSGTWAISLKLKINVGVTLAGWIKRILRLNEYSRTVADFTLMSWNGTWL